MRPMRRDEFRAWAREQPRRYERIDAMPVGMAPERAIHARLKAAVWRVLDDAVTRAGVPCEALTDGLTVEITDDSDFEPDAVVQCGDRLPDDAVVATAPVIVVEVLSPSTRADDFTRKFSGYFSVPTLQHYLVIETRRREVIHHRRGPDGLILSTIVASGAILLDPPGLSIDVADIYRAAGV